MTMARGEPTNRRNCGPGGRNKPAAWKQADTLATHVRQRPYSAVLIAAAARIIGRTMR
jgi:hypothetical protein